MEKELERQRLLEIERAKTRELRHNLDMEKERQTQVITRKTGIIILNCVMIPDFKHLFKLLM